MMKPRKIERLEGVWERLARGHERAMDGAEARLRVGLRTALGDATNALILQSAAADPTDRRRARVQLLQAGQGIGRRLLAASEAAIRVGQRDARERAASRQALALRRASLQLQIDTIQPASLSVAPEDEGLARAAAAAISARWLANVSAALLRWERRGDGPLESDLRRAQRDTLPRVDSEAVVQVARAYNDEHDEGALRLAEENKGASWLPLIVRRWDATRDKKLCPICDDLNGSYRPIGLQWPQGKRPGEVHRHCRCHEALVVLPVPLRMGETDEHRANNPRPTQIAA